MEWDDVRIVEYQHDPHLGFSAIEVAVCTCMPDGLPPGAIDTTEQLTRSALSRQGCFDSSIETSVRHVEGGHEGYPRTHQEMITKGIIPTTCAPGRSDGIYELTGRYGYEFGRNLF